MKAFVAAITAGLLYSGAAGAVPVSLDFNSITAGTIVSNQFPGVTIFGHRNGAPSGLNSAMIFDTENPTGNDTDLEGPFDNPTTAPNEMLEPQKVLIVSEDNDSGDPDDAAQGGMLSFMFDSLVDILSLNALDINNNESISFSFYDEDDNLISSTSNGATTTADNEYLEFLFDVTGVKKLVVDLSGSGAIDDLVYDVSEVPVPAALPLLLSGLAGLGFAARRKRKTV